MVFQRLFHKCVLVPKLVDAREEVDRAFPDVASVVNLPAPHLHLRVRQPDHMRPIVNLKRPLKHTPRPFHLTDPILPRGILHPTADLLPLLPHLVLKLRTLLHQMLAYVILYTCRRR
jgi:hypothetical protein